MDATKTDARVSITRSSDSDSVLLWMSANNHNVNVFGIFCLQKGWILHPDSWTVFTPTLCFRDFLLVQIFQNFMCLLWYFPTIPSTYTSAPRVTDHHYMHISLRKPICFTHLQKVLTVFSFHSVKEAGSREVRIKEEKNFPVELKTNFIYNNSLTSVTYTEMLIDGLQVMISPFLSFFKRRINLELFHWFNSFSSEAGAYSPEVPSRA